MIISTKFLKAIEAFIGHDCSVEVHIDATSHHVAVEARMEVTMPGSTVPITCVHCERFTMLELSQRRTPGAFDNFKAQAKDEFNRTIDRIANLSTPRAET